MRRRTPLAVLAAAALTATATMTALVAPSSADEPVGDAAVEGPCADVPWADPALSPERRATALLAASTLHQKYRWLVEQPANSPQQTVFSGVTYPVQVPCTPTVVYTDGPDGVRLFVPGVTAFPATIASAATWNPRLHYVKSAAHAAEAFDKRRNVLLAPGLAGGRTPLSGRTPEYLGEDPVLTGVLAAAAVRGMQEGDPDKPVLATLKHYVANEQELDRQLSSSNLDERTLREIYSLPFEIAVDLGRPGSVMCSYNQVNGRYACENPILDRVLKEDAGFDGYVMSDFGSVHSTAPSLDAGLDQELNRPVWFTPALLDQALAAGDITVRQVDRAAFRVVRAYIRAGLFDHPLPDAPVADASTEAHKSVAQRVAEQGSVLLKNDGALPLDTGAGDTVAVIGPTATGTDLTTATARALCSLPFRFGGGLTLQCEDVVTPLEAIEDRAAEAGATVVYDAGADPAAAAATAAGADVAVVFGYQRMGEFADIADLHLQGSGDQLVSAVAQANPSTVVVLQTGSAVEMPWVDDAGAILEVWYAGERMGPAIARLLFGDVNPSGKLPMTFPRSLADTPTAVSPERYPGVFADGSTTRPAGDTTSIRQVEYDEGLQVGYRWYLAQGIEPLFSFGHGLSYTRFSYDRLRVTPASTDGSKTLRVDFRLRNTGDRAGTEVAQVYVELPGSAGEPSKRLVGWARVRLAAGESEKVQVVLDRERLEQLHLLQYWSQGRGRWVTPSGTYEVTVGGSVDTRLSDTFRVR
jgi:beta-glucosidase